MSPPAISQRPHINIDTFSDIERRALWRDVCRVSRKGMVRQNQTPAVPLKSEIGERKVKSKSPRTVEHVIRVNCGTDIVTNNEIDALESSLRVSRPGNIVTCSRVPRKIDKISFTKARGQLAAWKQEMRTLPSSDHLLCLYSSLEKRGFHGGSLATQIVME